MKNSKLLIAAVIFLVLIIGIVVYVAFQNINQQTPGSNTTTGSTIQQNNVESTEEETTTPQLGEITITREDVAQKNTASDCYVIFNNDVYRIPQSWLNQHPGGRTSITQYCGEDMSRAFSGQHGSDTQALNQLRQYYLAPLSY